MQDELKQELAELEQEELDAKLMQDHVPIHHPAGASRVQEGTSIHRPLFFACNHSNKHRSM